MTETRSRPIRIPDRESTPADRDKVRVRVTRMGIEGMLGKLALVEGDRSYLSALETEVELADVRADLGIAARHLTIAKGALERIEEALGR